MHPFVIMVGPVRCPGASLGLYKKIAITPPTIVTGELIATANIVAFVSRRLPVSETGMLLNMIPKQSGA